jgi:hypothetical protein
MAIIRYSPQSLQQVAVEAGPVQVKMAQMADLVAEPREILQTLLALEPQGKEMTEHWEAPAHLLAVEVALVDLGS